VSLPHKEFEEDPGPTWEELFLRHSSRHIVVKITASRLDKTR
jgi:hypothetical protein